MTSRMRADYIHVNQTLMGASDYCLQIGKACKVMQGELEEWKAIKERWTMIPAPYTWEYYGRMCEYIDTLNDTPKNKGILKALIGIGTGLYQLHESNTEQ